MAKLKRAQTPQIVIAPDERLNTECALIEEIDDEVVRTAKEMAAAMYANHGCGLAAPQIGVLRQIVVIDVEWDGERKSTRNTLFLINPEVKDMSDEKVMCSEGCLSLPGITCEIERSTSVVVEAYDLEGRLLRYEAANNLLTNCLQHEIDHLHGITMFERLAPTEKMEALQRYQEALAAGARPGETGE